MKDEKRLALQSMPDDLMKLCKDQFGMHYLQFEIWVGQVIDKSFDIGKAKGLQEAAESSGPEETVRAPLTQLALEGALYYRDVGISAPRLQAMSDFILQSRPKSAATPETGG